MKNDEEKRLIREISRCRVRVSFWKNKTEIQRNELKIFYKKIHQENIDKAKYIIKLIKDRYSLSEDYNVLESQKPEVLDPIYKAIKLIDNNTKLTLYDFEPLFSRDRSTITYVLRTIDDIMDTDKAYKTEYESILRDNNLKYKRYKPRR